MKMSCLEGLLKGKHEHENMRKVGRVASEQPLQNFK